MRKVNSLYELEIYELIISNIKQLYGVYGEGATYIYFRVRYLISTLDNKTIFHKSYLIEFLLKELNIPLSSEGSFTYKNEQIRIEGSLSNIMDNWGFRAELFQTDKKIDKHIELLFNKITNKFKTLAKKESVNTASYYLYLKKYSLKELEKTFKANRGHSQPIEGVVYPINHNPFKRSLEEEIDSLVLAIELQTSSTNLITEEQLEDYLVNNLHKVEKGMTFIKRQLAVEEGIIDILAEDIEGIKVIIEIKIKEDTNIIWQSNYYPRALMEEYNLDKVRMITLCPSYSSKIKKILPGKVESLSYKLSIENRVIKDIIFSTVS